MKRVTYYDFDDRSEKKKSTKIPFIAFIISIILTLGAVFASFSPFFWVSEGALSYVGWIIISLAICFSLSDQKGKFVCGVGGCAVMLATLNVKNESVFFIQVIGIMLALACMTNNKWLRIFVLCIPGILIPGLMANPGLSGASDFSLLMQNVQRDNKSQESINFSIQSKNPDIVILTEVTKDWFASLSLLNYPYHSFDNTVEDGGVLILSKKPIIGTQVWRPNSAKRRGAVAALIEVDINKKVLFIGVHPQSPLSNELRDDRNTYLKGIAEWAGKFKDIPIVIAGDFNASPFSSIWKTFEARIKLHGHTPWWNGTFPSFLNIFGMSIDHLIANKNIELTRNDIFKNTSDHRGIFASGRVIQNK